MAMGVSFTILRLRVGMVGFSSCHGWNYTFVRMALDYPVHQFDQVIRGYGQGGLGAFEQRLHFEQRFHWGSLNFRSEL
jgi:hypothetical protein